MTNAVVIPDALDEFLRALQELNSHQKKVKLARAVLNEKTSAVQTMLTDLPDKKLPLVFRDENQQEDYGFEAMVLKVSTETRKEGVTGKTLTRMVGEFDPNIDSTALSNYVFANRRVVSTREYVSQTYPKTKKRSRNNSEEEEDKTTNKKKKKKKKKKTQIQ
jgi:hypothetical protein